MYTLVSRVPDGLNELKSRFETHVHSQGLAAVEKIGETATNVCGGCVRACVCVYVCVCVCACVCVCMSVCVCVGGGGGVCPLMTSS